MKNSVAALSEKLALKAQQDAELIESLQQEKLKKLAESLSSTLTSEVNTIQADIQKNLQSFNKQAQSLLKQQAQALTEQQSLINKHIQKTAKTLIWSWVKPTVTIIAILLVILGGSWGTLHYYTTEIQTLMDREMQLKKGIAKLKEDGGRIQLRKCGEQSRLCAKVNDSPMFRDPENGLWMILEGY